MQHDIAIISVIYSVHHNCNFVSLWHSLQSQVAYETFTEAMMACRGCSAASQLNSQLFMIASLIHGRYVAVTLGTPNIIVGALSALQKSMATILMGHGCCPSRSSLLAFYNF